MLIIIASGVRSYCKSGHFSLWSGRDRNTVYKFYTVAFCGRPSIIFFAQENGFDFKTTFHKNPRKAVL